MSSLVARSILLRAVKAALTRHAISEEVLGSFSKLEEEEEEILESGVKEFVKLSLYSLRFLAENPDVW